MMPRTILFPTHSEVFNMDPEDPAVIAAILKTNPVARALYSDTRIHAEEKNNGKPKRT